jgi:hypothetical protein
VSSANLCELDIDAPDRCAARRQYRAVRIMFYSKRGDHAEYGLSREDAKALIWSFYSEVSWYNYLGSK